MCGIIGYSGHRPAIPLLMEGLGRLEYRGYDSSGIAYAVGQTLHVVRAEGKLSALGDKLAALPTMVATTGIGHTRWATHGVPSERNAHPHCAGDGALAIVHNGIIENFQELKAELSALGHGFASETDTEVLACLILEERKRAPSLAEAFAAALRKARGAYSVLMLAREEPATLYAARLSAPLLLGVGVGECFVASDIPAFLPYTREVVFLEDGEIARVDANGWSVLRLADLAPVRREVSHIPWDMQAARKDGHKHYMLKEIMEQPRVLAECLAGRIHPEQALISLPELDALPVPGRLRIVACGTSYHAGLWARSLVESRAGIPTEVEIASEFRYRAPLLGEREMVLVISQSGETADTLAALRLAKDMGRPAVGLCNVMGSSIAREADAVIYTQAGPEISVASTKAMCSQMAALLALALYYGQRQNPPRRDAGLIDALRALPGLLESALPAMRETAFRLAPIYQNAASFFYLGRGPAFALALEGALKLKELSYIHAEGYASGEMKHGPIALVDADFPTFALALDDALLPKVESNIMEVQARRGKVIALTQTRAAIKADHVWPLPPSHPDLAGFLALPALQLFSYAVADSLGNDVDQPRNLAKSVTVE